MLVKSTALYKILYRKQKEAQRWRRWWMVFSAICKTHKTITWRYRSI